MSAFEPECGTFECPEQSFVNLEDTPKEPLLFSEKDDSINIFIEKDADNCEVKIKHYEGPRNSRNEPSGNGIAKLTNGDHYEGSFRKGLFSGQGVLRQRTGHRYTGTFRKGLREGRGMQTYPDCSTYNGDWSRGLRHGYGVYVYSNKDIYEGNWCMDKKHGIGVYTYAENCLRLRGSWNEGHLVGPVEVLFGSIRYHGTWDGTVLSDAHDSVFNIASKYLLRGIIKSGSFDEYTWTPRKIERYNFAHLPLEPLPAPIPMMENHQCDSSDDSTNDS